MSERDVESGKPSLQQEFSANDNGKKNTFLTLIKFSPLLFIPLIGHAARNLSFPTLVILLGLVMSPIFVIAAIAFVRPYVKRK